MNKKPWRNDHLTPHEVAKLLMVNPVTVRQWAARGHLPSHTTPGGHRRFLLREVQEFARARGILRSAQDGRPDRVLIIDVDDRECRLVADLIRTSNPAVGTEVASSGFEAGAKFEAFRPDAVVLDLTMPGVDPLDVCRRLRQGAALGPIRIVAITHGATPDGIERVLGAGASACLVKPLDPGRLLEELGLGRS
jgi:excisionase family DNA binding protein